MNKRIVIALGRSAFGDTFPEQQTNVKLAAKAVADIAEAGYQIILTHSNGQQIGMVHTAMTEFARLEPHYTVAPLSLCGAMSQGYIGYDLQNAIRTELLNRGLFRTVSTIITQVKVSPFDHAFSEPSKIIGRTMTAEEAAAEERKGNYVTRQENGYRRIIASPKPLEIYEIDAIRALADAGQIVIAAGGGGIPVLEQGTVLKGASAIIEKDLTAGKLAEQTGADTLLFLTDHPRVSRFYCTANEQTMEHVTLSEAKEYLTDGSISGGLLPKFEAAVSYLENHAEKKVLITDIASAMDALNGKTGTVLEA